ncbi:retrotransposon protein [Striga asiatica]|uniref:Retrotransposon protein n=1 Tax=Striga asiatica TaxID=4170 RepID=A0A5A7RGW8_STRAF|nr:retrotransposon protein [Striga asiatica]
MQWECLEEEKSKWGHNWFLGGDWNDILHSDDKRGGRLRADSSMQPFREFVGNMGMQSLAVRGTTLLGVITNLGKDLSSSDHSLLLLSLHLDNTTQRKRFCFNKISLRKQGLNEVIEKAWNSETIGTPISEKHRRSQRLAIMGLSNKAAMKCTKKKRNIGSKNQESLGSKETRIHSFVMQVRFSEIAELSSSRNQLNKLTTDFQLTESRIDNLSEADNNLSEADNRLHQHYGYDLQNIIHLSDIRGDRIFKQEELQYFHARIITMSNSGRQERNPDAGTSRHPAHTIDNTTAPSMTIDYSVLFQDPEFIINLSNFMAQTRAGPTMTIPSQAHASNPQIRQLTPHVHQQNSVPAASHATSQPRTPESQRNIATHNRGIIPVDDHPPEGVQPEITAESHSGRRQQQPVPPSPITSQHVRQSDLHHTIERNRFRRESDELRHTITWNRLRRESEALEMLRKIIAELETRQDIPEKFQQRVPISENVYLEAETPLAPHLTMEPLSSKVKVPQIDLYDGTSDPDAHL